MDCTEEHEEAYEVLKETGSFDSNAALTSVLLQMQAIDKTDQEIPG